MRHDLPSTGGVTMNEPRQYQGRKSAPTPPPDDNPFPPDYATGGDGDASPANGGAKGQAAQPDSVDATPAATIPAPTTSTAAPAKREKPSEQSMMTAAMRNQIMEQRTMANVMADIAGEGWGKKMTPDLRQQFAVYLIDNALDITECDVLGGNPYRNSKYYMRRLSELEEAGLVDDFSYDYVHEQPDMIEDMQEIRERLKLEATESALRPLLTEQLHRYEVMLIRHKMLRREHSIPNDALAACVVRIRLKGSTVAYEDAKWVVRDKKKKVTEWKNNQRTGGFTEVDADPVGNEYPIESALSRAMRRTLRMICSQNPRLAAIEARMDAQGKALAESYKVEMVKARPDRGLAIAPEFIALNAGQEPARRIVQTPGGREVEIVEGATDANGKVMHGRGTPEPPAERRTWQPHTFDDGEYGG